MHVINPGCYLLKGAAELAIGKQKPAKNTTKWYFSDYIRILTYLGYRKEVRCKVRGAYTTRTQSIGIA
jgi:hypothetical protein